VKRIVKHADLQALATERRDLLAPTARMWTQGLPEPAPEPVVPQAPEDAAARFLASARMVLGLSSEDVSVGYSVSVGPTALEPTGE
jgi:hypothetical protein